MSEVRPANKGIKTTQRTTQWSSKIRQKFALLIKGLRPYAPHGEEEWFPSEVRPANKGIKTVNDGYIQVSKKFLSEVRPANKGIKT